MARDVADDNFYVSSGGKIPAKWTAPEVHKFYSNHVAKVGYHFSFDRYTIKLATVLTLRLKGFANQLVIK